MRTSRAYARIFSSCSLKFTWHFFFFYHQSVDCYLQFLSLGLGLNKDSSLIFPCLVCFQPSSWNCVGLQWCSGTRRRMRILRSIWMRSKETSTKSSTFTRPSSSLMKVCILLLKLQLRYMSRKSPVASGLLQMEDLVRRTEC